MKCDDCEKDATVFVQVVAGDFADSGYLCQDCSLRAHQVVGPYLLLDMGAIFESPIEEVMQELHKDEPRQDSEAGERPVPSAESVGEGLLQRGPGAD